LEAIGFLVQRTFRRGLQGDNRPHDLLPYGVTVEVAAFEHLIGTFRGLDFGIRPVALNEQVGGASNVEVRNHEPIFQVVRAAFLPSIRPPSALISHTSGRTTSRGRINASLKKAQALYGFLSTLVIATAITACFLGVCWATVQIVSKPPWLELSLAAFSGVQSLVIWRQWVRLRIRVARVEAAEGRRSEPPNGPEEGEEESP